MWYFSTIWIFIIRWLMLTCFIWWRPPDIPDSTGVIDTGKLDEIWHHQSCGHLRAGRGLGSNSPSAAVVMACPVSRDDLVNQWHWLWAGCPQHWWREFGTTGLGQGILQCCYVCCFPKPASVCGVCSTVLLSSLTTGYINVLSPVLSTIAAWGRAVPWRGGEMLWACALAWTRGTPSR